MIVLLQVLPLVAMMMMMLVVWTKKMIFFVSLKSKFKIITAFTIKTSILSFDLLQLNILFIFRFSNYRLCKFKNKLPPENVTFC
mmetsp:Transcript_51426/g.52400  ORF Transcript_51426/g.52400 Transcript_51426/m.52400 type:complete len:84 (-) Transcript_51426:2884-3135(-)